MERARKKHVNRTGHKRALARINSELANIQRAKEFSPEALCFPVQRRAVESTAKRAVWKCGRRAGKTVGVAVYLIEGARKDPRGVSSLYMTLTRLNAEEIIWGDLIELNERFKLGGAPNAQKLSLSFPGAGVIRLTGCDNDRERGKVRGKKFARVVLDEPQNIPDRILRPLLSEDLRATMLDYGAPIRLVGTPSFVRSGYWWESYAGARAAEWEQHAWTVRDNPELPFVKAGGSIEEALAEIRKEEGWTEDSPAYRREYLGLDVEDLESLLFEVKALNHYSALPEGPWTTVLGVDIGYDDSDALAVLGWRRHDRTVYLLHEETASGQDVQQLGDRVEAAVARWKPVGVVMDTGGLGKKIAVTLQQRRGLPVEAADKARKAEHIALMNAALRRGELLVPSGGIMAEDAKLVRKDREALQRGILQELPVSKGGYHSDILDAVLYAWRRTMAYLEEDAPPPPPPERAGDDFEAQLLEQHAKRQQQTWVEADFGGDSDFLGWGE